MGNEFKMHETKPGFLQAKRPTEKKEEILKELEMNFIIFFLVGCHISASNHIAYEYEVFCWK